MNVKITKEQHKELEKLMYVEYLFGSQLHGIATEESDFDYVRVIQDSFYDKFKTLAIFLPNIHSWQYDGENNTQYVWMTETQFYRNFLMGDGNMLADIVILSGEFEDSLFLSRTYKVIKGYLGVAKRDLRLHGNNEKKRFHAYRSLYMADRLIMNVLPTIKDIQALRKEAVPTKEQLSAQEQMLRERLNDMLNNGGIEMYPKFEEPNELVQIMMNNNNVTEFKYEK